MQGCIPLGHLQSAYGGKDKVLVNMPSLKNMCDMVHRVLNLWFLEKCKMNGQTGMQVWILLDSELNHLLVWTHPHS